MQRKQRLTQMVSAIVEKGTLDVVTLAEQFAVSQATVRRDLEVLERQRLVSRTHGGASTHAAFNDLPLSYKTAQDLTEKRRIARQALEFLDGARVIGMTGGTTVTEFAHLLLHRDGLTVVTNALNIAAELALRPDIKLIVTGGAARSESYELVGPLAEAALQGMNLDLAVVGVDGITVAGGLTTHHDIEAHTNRVLIGRARRVIVVADGSKVGHLAFSRICTVSSVHELITDASASALELERLADAGIVITTV